jgi:arylsulfate sulfotransferase
MRTIATIGTVTLLVVTLCGTGSAAEERNHDNGKRKSGPEFLTRPSVVQNPNPDAPLAAVLSFEADRPVETTIDIEGPGRAWSVSFGAAMDPQQGLPILGLRPAQRYIFQVSMEDAEGLTNQAQIALVHNTPRLPESPLEWPRIRVKADSVEAMEPGITILSVRRTALGRELRKTEQTLNFSRNWGLLLGLDNEGEVVWYYRSSERIAGVALLRNGHLLFHLTDFRSVEIDFLGNKIGEYYAQLRPDGPIEGATPIHGIQTLHHQPHEMPNGHFLAFSANARTIENYYTSLTDQKAPRATQKVMGDRIIEFNRAGEILWQWDTFDYLDVFRVGYDLLDGYWTPRGFPKHLDWTHGNGLFYDAADDSVIVNLKHQDATLKIDRNSGEIRWILGEPSDWTPALAQKLLKRPDGMRWPYHAHNPRITADGTLMLYENAQWGARPFTDRLPHSPNQAVSRAVEYRIDEQNMTVSEVWSSARGRSDDTCHAPFMGDAHRLPKTDNVLVIDSLCFDQERYPVTYDQHDFKVRHISEVNQHARIREYTHTREPRVLWEAILDDPDAIINWQVYGGLRMPDFYSRNNNVIYQ